MLSMMQVLLVLLYSYHPTPPFPLSSAPRIPSPYIPSARMHARTHARANTHLIVPYLSPAYLFRLDTSSMVLSLSRAYVHLPHQLRETGGMEGRWEQVGRQGWEGDRGDGWRGIGQERCRGDGSGGSREDSWKWTER